jgi:NAD-dependent dihydropyrimidine dehydrogenase PreA subunit
LEQGADALTPALQRIRAAEPVKSFLFPARQQVASFPEEFAPAEPERQILFGVKNCDVIPLQVHQKILMEGEFADPFYTARRRNTAVIAADCPVPEETCFCNLLGLTPYATEGADIVLSVVDDAYLVQTLTPQGEELVNLAAGAFGPATDVQKARRAEIRKSAVAGLQRVNPKPWNPDLPRAIAAKMADHAFWQKHAATCVECFGCLFGCPTCYCFLLSDRPEGSGVARTRIWDACYEAAYTRVGGGANPRGEFLKRFANRFECKWKEFKNDHGFYSCSGCGRCFKVCMGKIDIRKVLGEL